MDIHEERKDGFLVLGLEGRLDAVSSKMFEEKVLAFVDGGENGSLSTSPGWTMSAARGSGSFSSRPSD